MRALFSCHSSVFSPPGRILTLAHSPKVILYGKLVELPNVIGLTSSAGIIVWHILCMEVFSPGVENVYTRLEDCGMCNERLWIPGTNLADQLETWHSRIFFSAPGLDAPNQYDISNLGASRRINQSETAQRFHSAGGYTILSDGR